MEKRQGRAEWESHREEALRACRDVGNASEDSDAGPAVADSARGWRAPGRGRSSVRRRERRARTWRVSGNPREGACVGVFMQEADQPEAGPGGAHMLRSELHSEGDGQPRGMARCRAARSGSEW